MRYELKYAIDHIDHHAIVAELLSRHPSSFTRLFPDRQVNNIYFDTSQFHCFHQNIEGQPRRRKLRIRWYGTNSISSSATTLEVKNKDRELGWKRTIKLDHKIVDSLSAIQAIQEKGFTQGNLVPVLCNSYLRSYYISSNGLFRMTIDRMQRFSLPFQNNLFENKRHAVIIEIKYAKEDENLSNEVTDFIPYRQSKNSKYAVGVQEVYGVGI